ncbi:MAG: YCF48-related protein [Nevskia sp.]|nr:YCF48-related protein [Nevskia sp.]
MAACTRAKGNWGAAALLLSLLAGAGPAQAIDTMVPRPAEPAPKAAHSILLDLAFTGQRYVSVGQRGDILVSDDAREWKQVPGPVRQMLNRVRFVDQQYGWAVGYDGVILNTRDGGLTWILQNFDPKAGLPFFDVAFLDRSHGIAVGARGLLKHSDDGGASWQDINADFVSLGLNLYSICRLKDGTLLITGERGMLARSVDGGATWSMLQSPYAGSLFGAVPDGEAGAVVFGMRGKIYRVEHVATVPTEDPKHWDEMSSQALTGAERPSESAAVISVPGWTPLNCPVKQGLFGGVRTAGGGIVLVGADGTVVTAAAGATEFTLQSNPSNVPFAAVLPQKDGLLVVGRNGVQHLQWSAVP